MAKFDIIMPKLGESIIEATITRWVKSVGEEVEEDDSLVEIATDKVDSEIPSPVEGKLVEVLYNEGDVVPVGKVIAVVDMGGEDGEETPTAVAEDAVKEDVKEVEAAKEETTTEAVTTDAPAKSPEDFSSSDRFYSPLVKNIAKTEGISVTELDGIAGSGKDGRVTKVDILAYLDSRKSGAAPAKFVGQGEAAVAIVFSHDIVNEIENNQMPLELTFPAEGTGYEIGGQAILKGAKNIQAAKLWFDWAISPEGQALGPKYNAYQAPTVNGVELSHPELMEAELIDYNFIWCGENKSTFVDKFTNEIQNADNLKQ